MVLGDFPSKVPCHLINTAELLLDAAIAPNNKSTYRTAIQKMLLYFYKYFPKAELTENVKASHPKLFYDPGCVPPLV
jgi:hypothetical protein